MNERRIGRFKVDADLLMKAVDTGHGQNLFVGMVPLDLQRDWWSNVVTFTAWHKDFASIPAGRVAPEYRAVFKAGQVVPTWEHVEGT